MQGYSISERQSPEIGRDFHLRRKELLGRVSSFLLTIKKAIKLRKAEGKGGLGDVVRKIHYFKNSPRVKSSTKACRQLLSSLSVL